MKPVSTPLMFPLAWRENPGETVADKIYLSVREAILTHRLAAGARVPSTRELHRQLSVSRATIVEAYEKLTIEGYLEPRTGSGSYVTNNLPDSFFAPEQIIQKTSPRRKKNVALSPQAAYISSFDLPNERFSSPGKPFRAGVGPVDLFAARAWATLSSRRWRNVTKGQLGWGGPAGALELRRSLAEYVNHTRGMRLVPDQILITAGSQPGIHLAAALLLGPGDRAYMEEPGYLAARLAIHATGAEALPLPVDPEGVTVPPSVSKGSPSVVFITPSFQYPLGYEMSLRRRLELLDWVKRREGWIIEDDYDCEFRYRGHPIASLQALDAEDRTIYCATFSKSVAPALRLGFVALPEALVDSGIRLKRIFGSSVPTVDQLIFADYIDQGHFARHSRRLRAVLAERHRQFMDESRIVENFIEIQPTEHGLHILGLLHGKRSDTATALAGDAQGLQLTQLSPFYMNKRSAKQGFLFGFGGFGRSQTRKALLTLRAILEGRFSTGGRN